MTPPVLALKAEKENVIQSLRNNVSQQTESEAIFSGHMRGKEKHFSETASYGWLLWQLEVKQTAEQSCIMTIKL